MKLIYGTGNTAKLKSMERTLKGLPFEIIGMIEAAEEKGIQIPEIQENGSSVLENARIKAKAYYEIFQSPVFSCDSGLYLWHYETGEMLPKEEQPGIHVRGRDERRLTDDELIAHYLGLVEKYGPISARYKNGICLILDGEHCYESMDETLWGKAFLLADKPHEKRIKGFPLDSISLEITTGQYYYDLEDHSQDKLAAEAKNFRNFFKNALNNVDFCGK